MEADDVALLKELGSRTYSLHASGLDDLCGAVSIVGQHFHVEALGNASHVATHSTEGEDAQTLGFQLGAAGAVEEVTFRIHEETEDEFCHAVGVLTRGVHSHHFVSRSGIKVDIVITRARAYHYFKLLGSVEDFGIDFVGADNHSIHIGDSLQELCLLRIFLQKDGLVASGIEHLLNALHGHTAERLLCCN